MTKIAEADGVVTFHLGKSYDALHSNELQRLEAAIAEQVNASACPRLVFDFSETTYVSSSFVEAVMRGWKKLQEKNGQMALCCLNNNCATVLKVCRLDRIWNILPTHDEAVAAVQNESE